jgi:hypothetical protein
MKKTTTKLALRGETIRTLGDAELTTAAGGVTTCTAQTYIGSSCFPPAGFELVPPRTK